MNTHEIAERILTHGTLAYDSGGDLTVPFNTWKACVLVAGEYLSIAARDEQHRKIILTSMLPDDMADAFEAFKLSIIRHRNAGFKEVPREEVVAALAFLRGVIDQPEPQGSAPF